MVARANLLLQRADALSQLLRARLLSVVLGRGSGECIGRARQLVAGGAVLLLQRLQRRAGVRQFVGHVLQFGLSRLQSALELNQLALQTLVLRQRLSNTNTQTK